jgi:hypothetical protein
MTSEAYALLRYNGEFLRDKLKEQLPPTKEKPKRED